MSATTSGGGWCGCIADQRTTTTRSGGTDPGTTTHQWDADGNLTDSGRQYDPLGRLTAASAATHGNATYTYNALGHRRSITTDPDVTNWSWDINNPLPMLAQSATGGQAPEEYDYTPDGWILSSTTDAPAGQSQWYTHDALGSLMDAFGQTGADTWRRTYDAWGTITSDTQADPASPRPVFGYTSAVEDPATILWHLRARDYDPNLRAFTAPDSVERPTDQPRLSTYGYADLQPALLTDPSGRCTSTYCPPPQTPSYCLASGGYCSGPPPVYGPVGPLDPHVAGDLAGILYPPADFANAAWYASEGSWGQAAFSIFCAVPILGDAAAIIRAGRNGGKASRLVPGGGLSAHEAAGGHVLRKHVNVTDADLLTRLAREPGISAASRFSSRGVAEASIAKLIDSNSTGIQAWLSGPGAIKIVSGRPGGVTGRSVPQGSTQIRDVTGVRVVLFRDSSLPTGYRIHTAYPEP